MADGPRGRRPFTPSSDRTGPGKPPHTGRGDDGRRDNAGRADETRRDGYGGDRTGRFGRREQRPANPQTTHRRTVHYQVVTMDDEEWGDALEHRLNALGHDGWRLVAIDEGRQYVFSQAE